MRSVVLKRNWERRGLPAPGPSEPLHFMGNFEKDGSEKLTSRIKTFFFWVGKGQIELNSPYANDNKDNDDK